jgi:hypothetical protein
MQSVAGMSVGMVENECKGHFPKMAKPFYERVHLEPITNKQKKRVSCL